MRKMTNLFDFRPTWRGRFTDSLSRAKGLRPFDAIGYDVLGYPRCYICGRQEDFIFNSVLLIRHFDMSLDNKLVYICTDHGRVTNYDCTTSESIELPLPKPYWRRRIRDTFYQVVLNVVIPARFAWFFIYDTFMWYVGIWFYLFWRNLKLNH